MMPASLASSPSAASQPVAAAAWRCRPVPAALPALGRPGTKSAVARSSNGRGDGNRRVDWDREWNSYINDRAEQDAGAGSGSSRRSNVYTTTSGSGGGPTSRPRVPVDPAARMTRDAIKREEAFLLNTWTSDKFQGAGAAVAVIVLLVLLLAAGPPPADSRCTLPWC